MKRFGGRRIRVYLACMSIFVYIVARVSVSNPSYGFPSWRGSLGGGGALPLLKVVGTCRWTGYDFSVINIGTGYLNRPNWLLAGYSVYHRVASQGFPAEFPAHNVYDRPAIAAPAILRAGRNRFRVFHFFLL